MACHHIIFMFEWILRHNKMRMMKTTPQLITAGILLSTACLLIVIWVIALFKDATIVSFLCRSRLTPSSPLKQPQTHHEIVVKPVFPTVHDREYRRDINRLLENPDMLNRRPKEVEVSLYPQRDIHEWFGQERRLTRLKLEWKKKLNQDRFLEAKLKLFRMNIITPEEWGQLVTGHDPITMKIEELLESGLKLNLKDYEEINGKVKETRKTAEVLRKMQDEIERDIAEKEAEGAQMRSVCDRSVTEN